MWDNRYVRFPLSLCNVEDLLHERGIDICHETVRHWDDRFGTYFAHKIRKRRSEAMRRSPQSGPPRQAVQAMALERAIDTRI